MEKIETKKSWVKRHPILTGLGILIVLFIVIGSSGSDSTSSTTQTTNTTTQREVVPPEPMIKVTASQLAREYNANGVSADAKYKDKRIEISGTIKSISRDILDDAYVSLAGDSSSFSDVQCMFTKADEGVLVNLSEGNQIVVQGEVSSMLLNVIVRDCKVISS